MKRDKDINKRNVHISISRFQSDWNREQVNLAKEYLRPKAEQSAVSPEQSTVTKNQENRGGGPISDAQRKATS